MHINMAIQVARVHLDCVHRFFFFLKMVCRICCQLVVYPVYVLYMYFIFGYKLAKLID